MDSNLNKNKLSDLFTDTFKSFDYLPIGILVFDENFDVVYVNRNLNKFGLPRLSLDENSSSKNILKDEYFQTLQLKEELLKLQEGNLFEKEIKNLKTASEREISVILKGSPFFENDTFKGGFLVVEDLNIIPLVRFDESFLTRDFFEQIIMVTYSAILIIDSENKIKLFGGKEFQYFILKRGKIIDKPVELVLHREISDKILNILEKTKKSLKTESFEVELAIKTETKTFEVLCNPILGSNKELKFTYLFLNDISIQVEERKRLELQIDELKYYQVITETATDAVVGLDESGKVIFWNKSADKLFGYSRSEVYGKVFGKVTRSYDDASFSKIFSELEREKTFKVKLPVYTKAKEKRTCEIVFSVARFNPDNKIVIAICTDITEKESIERMLRVSEERFRNIVQNTAELICNYNSEGMITYTNPSFCDTLGYEEQEILAKNIIDLIPGDFIKQKKFNVKTLYQVKTHYTEIPLLKKTGEKVVALGTFSVSKDIDESKKIFNGIFTDITDKKAAEQELSMMRKIFDASNDGIAIEKEGKFLLVNDSFTNIFGYAKSTEMMNLFTSSIASESEKDRLIEYIKKASTNNSVSSQHEFLAVKKDGNSFYAEVSATSFEFDDNVFTVLIAREITERKRTQQAIKDSEEKYRSITENLDDFFWMSERIEDKLRLMFFTTSVQKVTGYLQTEFLKSPRLIFKIIYPDDFLMFKKKLKNLQENYYKNLEEIELRIVHKTGNIVWVRNKIKVLRNSGGQVQKMYGLVSDISLEKKAEIEIQKTAEDLKKLNDAKDKFISIISHDLRTPFSSILGFTDMLLNDEDLSPKERKQYVSYIKESSESMLALVNSILDWTRLQTGRIKFEPQKVAINNIIRKAINSSRGFAMKKQIDLVDKLTSEFFVFIDSGLILQVINNLISNAMKFTPAGGTITVNALQSEKPRFIEVTVSDTGVGIAEENIPKIFSIESKFTTVGTDGEKGTGLGLSLVREIVEKHGGKIWVESKLNKGTDFKFLLPKASAKILMIDDSNTDRILYSKLLKSIIPDYEIVTARNGLEGFDVVVESAPALVVTDHLMPEMNGYEFVKKLVESEIRGKPPVIVLSADIRRGEILAYNELGVEYIFTKPVNLNTLKDAIQNSLKKFTL